MNAVDTQILIIHCSMSFYRRELRRIIRAGGLTKAGQKRMWEIHLRLSQLNRDLDKLLSK